LFLTIFMALASLPDIPALGDIGVIKTPLVKRPRRQRAKPKPKPKVTARADFRALDRDLRICLKILVRLHNFYFPVVKKSRRRSKKAL